MGIQGKLTLREDRNWILANVQATRRVRDSRLATHEQRMRRIVAVNFMYDNLIPFCRNCGSARDLVSCSICSDAAEGLWVFCGTCWSTQHGKASGECEPHGFTRLAPDFRHTAVPCGSLS